MPISRRTRGTGRVGVRRTSTRHRSKWILTFLPLLALVMTLAASGWAGSKKAESASAPNASSNGRAKLIQAFPKNVRPLLTPDIPTPTIALLLKVRRLHQGTVVIWDSGGQLFAGEQKAYINNWQKITGWKVKDIAPSPTPGQVKAQVSSGHPNFDLYETGSNGDALVAQRQGLLDKLNQGVLKQYRALVPKGQGYQSTPYWLQYSFFGVNLIWDTRLWPLSGKHPTTPNDLFNLTAFPGKRCLYKYPEYGGTLEYALLADGVSPSHLYPLDVQRAFKKLDTIKKDVVWWTSGSDSVQNIVSGNCAMGVTWQGRPALTLASDPSTPIAVSWNKVLLIDSGWAIPKGAKNAVAANSLLAYGFTPRNQCKFINTLGYGIPMDAKCINKFGNTWGVTTAHRKLTVAHQSPAYYVGHIESLIQQFNAWLTS